MANKKPVDTLRDGTLKVSIWAHTGDKGTFYKASVSNSYRGKEGKWQDTTNFNRLELLQIARLMEQAFDRITDLRTADRLEETAED